MCHRQDHIPEDILLLRDLFEILPIFYVIILLHELAEMLPHDVVVPETQDLLYRRIDIGEISVNVQVINDVRRIFREGAEPLFTLEHSIIAEGIVDTDRNLRCDSHEETLIASRELSLRRQVIHEKDPHGLSLVHDGHTNEGLGTQVFRQFKASGGQIPRDIIEIID